jgi:hypothetical protein
VLVRIVATASVILALLLASFMVGRASERDEATVTVHVSSADHELEEGYFSLGDGATMMVKPGTELYGFLARKKGHSVRLTLTDLARPEPAKLER